MTSFSFNFHAEQLESQKEEETTINIPAAHNNGNNNDDDSTIIDTNKQQDRLPFHWITSEHLKALLIERTQEEIIYTEIGFEDSTQQQLRCVDLSLSSFQKVPDDETTALINDQETTTNPTTNVWQFTDIQPGIYEGGRKIWEASLDLLQFFVPSTNVPFKDDDDDDDYYALELGCGHGLPMIYLLRQCLLQKKKFHVTLTDYNDSVLLDATLSNLVLNCCGLEPEEISVDEIVQHITLGSGDWLDMSNQIVLNQTWDNHKERNQKLPLDGKFDLILAAETMYSEQAARETAILIKRHLKPSGGIAYVATKRYYFGVGGGVDAFREYAQNDLDIETVRVHDDGSSNIREILRVTLKTTV